MAVERSAKYAHFVALCEGISKTGNKDKKRTLLNSFVERWRKSCEQTYPSKPQPAAETFYPFLRLLLPEADRDRPAYGMKETVLARMFIQELSLSQGGKASETLLHWKKNKPPGADYREVADFAGVAYHVLQDRLSKNENENGMSIFEINKFLDELAEANGVGGEEKKERTNQAFRDTLRRLDRLEWKWLIRIILKDARLNMGEDTILNTFHPDAAELYDATTSLSGLCTKLTDPKVRLSQIEISLFSPFRPMLADAWSPAKLRGILKGNELLAEIKYDGERCQMHKSGSQFKYFSRNKADNTEILGGNSSKGNLTRHFAECFAPRADSFILDGEICAFDIKENCIATKTDSYAIKLLTGENGYQICFVAFDCLFYNGKTITGLPFARRLAILKDLFEVKEGRLYHATRKEVATTDDCYDFLNEAIDRNEEGIILKQLSSVYKPNARTAGWWKVKPEYVDSLSDQLDVLVVGGYYGTGRRTGFSHFLLAVAQDPEKPGEQPKKFLSFCKVGTGYTYKELQEMGLKLAPHIRTGIAKPAWLTIVGEKEKPDAYIEPDKSFIVKVSAAQLLDSNTFATGCTLRFPRLKECRTDKNWYECMTLSQLLDLKSQSGGRLGAKHVPDGHFKEGGSPTKKQKTTIPRMAVGRLAEHFRPADTSGVTTQGNIFAGKEFHVVDGDKANCKQDLEKLIVSYGGTAVQDVSPGRTFCVIANKKTARVANLIKSKNYDVVYPSWILRCVAAKEIFPWHPKDLMFVREQTQKLIANAFDKYGDSFTEKITLADLEKLLIEMDDKEISRTKLVKFEDRYFGDFPVLGLFRTCVAYFDSFVEIGDPSSQQQKPNAGMILAKVEYVASGGLVVDKISPDVTHVVVSSTHTTRLEAIKRLNHTRTKKFHIVHEQWILKSVEQGVALEERSFGLKAETRDETSQSSLLLPVF